MINQVTLKANVRLHIVYFCTSRFQALGQLGRAGNLRGLGEKRKDHVSIVPGNNRERGTS